ncbi:NUCLEASE HARBI1-LIKE PROTEIN [Salix purpurea]|uniref:NUCLEASE HARBI1-LIKE PROTEIN n=1 Tax=Salix purpurea TaxID=77065 RepID=A0A9Q0W3L2_SALPP|nr:NUCLEASE HARBI1-LIKE PROTEIN [Salix purpurea]
MENSDDEKDGVFGNCMPKELSISLTNGTKFVDEVLRGPSDRCLENFRMDKQAFYKLCDILQGKGLLRHTNRIKIEEQLAIFLFIIGHNLRTRAVQELFRYSGETISRHFNNVLNAIMAISLDFFQPPGSDIPPEILEDPRFYPYFKALVGGYPPRDSRELFNQRHLLLRNVTDRIFGALKARFPILMSAPPYPLQTQVKLVVAAFYSVLFFHDRSTTLGTLMGVTFPCHHFQSTFPKQRHPTAASSTHRQRRERRSPGRSTMKRRNTGGFCGGGAEEKEVVEPVPRWRWGKAGFFEGVSEVERRFGGRRIGN